MYINGEWFPLVPQTTNDYIFTRSGSDFHITTWYGLELHKKWRSTMYVGFKLREIRIFFKLA